MKKVDGKFCLFILMLQVCGKVAQSVEQRPEKPCVGGSIPPLATSHKIRVCSQFALSFLLEEYALLFMLIGINLRTLAIISLCNVSQCHGLCNGIIVGVVD